MKEIKGRAEYEDKGYIRNSNLFEDKEPREIFPFAYDGEGIGMIVAQRGGGKTYLARKIAQETPTNFYMLDKDSLEYRLLNKEKNPWLIVGDDIHYLLHLMRLKRMSGEKVDETKVLNTIQSFVNEAKELEVPLVFISDEGPAGLYFSFKYKKNQKKFLEIFKDCVPNSDDSLIIQNLLNYHSTKGNNVLCFRNELAGELLPNIKRELNIQDGPLTTTLFFINCRKSLKEEYGILVQDGVWTDVQYRERWNKTWEEMEPNLNRLICPIREFKVISDELGEVSRKTLEIEQLGIRFYNDGYMYNLTELETYSKIIQQKYRKFAERGEFLPVAKAMLLTEDDNEAHKFLLAHSLQEEYP